MLQGGRRRWVVMSRRRLVANLIMLGASQAVTLSISFFYTILIGRYLGPDHLGQLLLAGAVTSVVMQASDLGIGTLIARTVARTPERTAALVCTGVVLRAAFVLPVAVALFAYSRIAQL